MSLLMPKLTKMGRDHQALHARLLRHMCRHSIGKLFIYQALRTCCLVGCCKVLEQGEAGMGSSPIHPPQIREQRIKSLAVKQLRQNIDFKGPVP